MKSSLILGVVLLLTIAHIAQARKSGCITCGGSLGSGTNPCKCGDVVVKAAKVQKPLYYATPEAINEAATAREVAQLMSSKTFPGNVAPFPQYSQTNGLYGVGSDASHSSSSSSYSSSASSSSSADLFGGSVKGDFSRFYPFSQRHTHNSGCGCGSKSKVSLELSEPLLSNTQRKVAPRFLPIGDLCEPTKQVSYEVSTKVTPAYPKLNFYRTSSTPLCLNVVNGQIDRTELEKLASATSYSGIGGLGVLDGSNGGSIGGYLSGGVGAAGSLGGYSSNVMSNSLGYSDFGWGASDKYFSQNLGSDTNILGERYGTFDNWYRPSSTGTGFSGRLGQVGSIAQSYAGSSVGGTEVDYGTSSFDRFHTGYGSVQGPIERSKCIDFGDDFELPEDYSYPRQPADAVSLTLAYKNLFPHTAVYSKKWFVPEDKLAFGHRTVPVEWRPKKKPSDIPEERLQILDKPIVELKPMAPIPVSVGVYDEQEEAKLAELEAIERERISQEEKVRQPQGSFITYGDLGYAPVDGLIVPGKLMRPGASYVDSGVGLIDAEDAIGEGCGPLGPPVPGYVPGNIMVNREVVEIEGENESNSRRNERIYFRHYLDDVSDEEDDFNDSTSGIFAKLRNTAQKYGPITYPR